MNAIYFAGIQPVHDTPCLIEIDEYVPFRFRTYSRPIGAGYLRLGNRTTRLLELIVDPSSRALRGVTLTAFEAFEPWPERPSVASSPGLPILRATVEAGRGFDVDLDYSVSFRESELLIRWGALSALSAIVVCGTAEFLISKNELIGLRFFNLSGQQNGLLAAFPRATSP